jgi:hypothetical protein
MVDPDLADLYIFCFLVIVSFLIFEKSARTENRRLTRRTQSCAFFARVVIAVTFFDDDNGK